MTRSNRPMALETESDATLVAKASFEIIRPGWFIAREDGLLQTFLGLGAGDPEFDAFVRVAALEIDERPTAARLSVVYWVPYGSTTGSASQRRALAEMLERRKDKLRQTTAAFVMVTDSAVVRAIMSAVWWLAPPPYPHKIEGDLGIALNGLKASAARLDVPKQLVALRRRRELALATPAGPRDAPRA